MAHKTPSYDTKMLLKVVFDKTVFVKFKTSNNVKQNIDETLSNNNKSIGKSCQPTDFKNLKKKIFEPKVL
jgi:hypothetical protein